VGSNSGTWKLEVPWVRLEIGFYSFLLPEDGDLAQTDVKGEVSLWREQVFLGITWTSLSLPFKSAQLGLSLLCIHVLHGPPELPACSGPASSLPEYVTPRADLPVPTNQGLARIGCSMRVQ
jgi:hypothetical protein